MSERILYQPRGQTLVVGASSSTFYSDESLSTAVSAGDTLPTTDTTYYAAAGATVRIVLEQIDGDEIFDETYTLSTLGDAQPPVVRPGPTLAHAIAEMSTPRWDDLRVSLSTARSTGSGNPGYEVFRNGVYAYAFAAASTESVYFEVQTPHTWLAGSGIRPHVHWSPGNSTNTGTVRWELEWTWANAVNAPGNVFPATSSATVDQAASGTPYAHQIAAFAEIDGAGMRLSSVLICRLSRLGGATEDTFTADAYGISVDFHLQHVGHGSREEYPS